MDRELETDEMMARKRERGIEQPRDMERWRRQQETTAGAENSNTHTDSERDSELKRNPKSTRDKVEAKQRETGQGGKAQRGGPSGPLSLPPDAGPATQPRGRQRSLPNARSAVPLGRRLTTPSRHLSDTASIAPSSPQGPGPGSDLPLDGALLEPSTPLRSGEAA